MTGGSRGCGHCCRVNHGECSECRLQRAIIRRHLHYVLFQIRSPGENGHWHFLVDKVHSISFDTSVKQFICTSLLRLTLHWSLVTWWHLCSVLTPPWLRAQWATVTSPGPGPASACRENTGPGVSSSSQTFIPIPASSSGQNTNHANFAKTSGQFISFALFSFRL